MKSQSSSDSGEQILSCLREVQNLNNALEKKVIEFTTQLESIYKDLVDYKFALDASNIVSITDKNGAIQYVNDNFCKISKYKRDELIGQNHRIFNSGYHSKEFFSNLWQTILNGKIWKGEVRNMAKDGSTYWVDTAIVPFISKNGKPFKYLVIRSDITQRVNSLEELKNANKELESFNYVSSHDLQEPLRKIKDYTTLLIKQEGSKLSEKGNYYLENISKTVNGMQILIEDLLAYSRTKTSDRNFEKSDINKIIEDVITDFKEIIKEKKITIKTNGSAKADVIIFQFRQLLHNLVSNSIKFINTQNSPKIIIKSEMVKGDKIKALSLPPHKKYCQVSISDNGVGFDPKFKDRIFEIFQRLHESDKYKGTGVGLAICKRIVENHNGIITATGEPGKGATFDIYIPVR